MRLRAGTFFGSSMGSRTVRGFRFTETHFEAGTQLPPHAHELPHFCLVLEGTFTERLGSRNVEHSAATLIFHPAETEHVEAHHTKNRHFVVEVEPSHFDSVRESATGAFEPRVFTSGTATGLAARIVSEFRDPDEFSSLALEGLALALLVESLRTGVDRDRAESRPPRWLGRVDETLCQSFSDPPTLGRLAEGVGIHPVHLASTFRKHRGCTIGEYVRRLRVDYACRRLVGSNDAIVEIALESGFSDQAHFSRSFKRVTGMTPARYREICRNS